MKRGIEKIIAVIVFIVIGIIALVLFWGFYMNGFTALKGIVSRLIFGAIE